MNIIVYFKLNPKLVQKFDKKMKNDEETKLKNVIIGKNNKSNNINNKQFIDNNLIEIKKKQNKVSITEIFKKLKPPIFLNFNPKISNPIKKIKKDVYSFKNPKKNNKNKNSRNSREILYQTKSKNKKSELITIELNGIKMELNEKQLYEKYLLIKNYKDSELNSLPYEKAIKLEKRKFCGYYLSLVRTNHLFFFSFLFKFDYNSRTLKIFLFFFNLTVAFVVNALFFNDDTMHKIYIDKGSFNFIYNFPKILYSSLISGLTNAIIKLLAVTYSSFIELKQKSSIKNIRTKNRKIINKFKIKFILFFIISLVLLVNFWFYLACFCAVYKNTQIHLIKDTLISFGTSMIYPFCIYIFPGIFRMIALKGKNREYIYNFSKILQMI